MKCKIRCIETNIVYSSLKEAATAVGLKGHASILESIKNPNKTAAKFHWEYYEEHDLFGEIWKEARHYTFGTEDELVSIPEILVSNMGRIKSVSNNQILEGSLEPDGYIRIGINNRRYFAHRLVASTFIPNPENKPTVDHINTDTRDNRIENLRWATQKEQVTENEITRERNLKASKESIKLAQKNNMKKVICITTNEIFDSIKEGADKYNIRNAGNICRCCTGKYKYAGKLPNGTPLVWQYVD